MTSPGIARWRSWIGYGLAALALVFSIRYVGLNLAEFTDAIKRLSPAAITFALAAFFVQIAINAFSFAFLNRAFGVSNASVVLARVWVGTLMTKYVPGGIWHVVGRGLALSRLGVSARATLIVGVAEQGISLLFCALIGATLFLGSTALTPPQEIALITIAVGILLLSAGALLVAAHPVDRGALATAVLGYAVAMIPYAFGYLFLIAPEMPVRFLAALFAGTVAGVLAIPVPGGLGIRESVTSLLAEPANSPQVFAAMLSARVLIFVAELSASAFNISVLRSKAIL